MAYKIISPEHLKVTEDVQEIPMNIAGLQKGRLDSAYSRINKQLKAAISERMKAKAKTEVLRWDYTIASLGMQKALIEAESAQWGYMQDRLASKETLKQSMVFLIVGLAVGGLIMKAGRRGR